MELRKALGLGLELSGLIFFSHIIHKTVALKTGCEENTVLGLLIIVSFIFWIIHVYILVGKKK